MSKKNIALFVFFWSFGVSIIAQQNALFTLANLDFLIGEWKYKTETSHVKYSYDYVLGNKYIWHKRKVVSSLANGSMQ